MSVCVCSLAGTAACKYCACNPNAEVPPTVCTFTTSTASAPKDYPFFKMREERPQTNADRIRDMTDEELAAKIEELCQYTFMQISVYAKPFGKAEWLDWLKKEVSE